MTTQLEAILNSGPPVRGDRVMHALSMVKAQDYEQTFKKACRQGFTNPLLAQILTKDSGVQVDAKQVQYYRTKLREGRV